MILQFSSSNYRLNQYVWGHILTPVDNKTTVKTCIVYNIIIFWAFLPLLHSKVVKKHRKAGGGERGRRHAGKGLKPGLLHSTHVARGHLLSHSAKMTPYRL